MAKILQNKLRTLYADTAPGSPLTVKSLKALNISADLAAYYARSGWLIRLAQGVYAKPNDALNLHACLAFLENQIEGLHVGGKSALDWHGVRHYVSAKPALTLYGWQSAKLPTWFTDRFPAQYHRKRIFKEQPQAMLHVDHFEQKPEAPLVSAPERAILEVFSEVGNHQPLQEARELTESTYSLRTRVLSELLKECTSVKTVRLCLILGNDLSLPWRKKLDVSQLSTGSGTRWVSRSPQGLLVLKP